jgi:hypothetical protein
MISAGGVAEMLVETGKHLFHDAGVDRGRGVVIHVDWQFHGAHGSMASPASGQLRKAECKKRSSSTASDDPP